MIDLSVLVTESRNEETMGLDQMTPLEIVAAMNREDGKAVAAVGEVLPQIAQAIAWCTDSLKQKGRIIYIGAGTSGRLGVLDAVECPPTFGVSRDVVVGLMAGGSAAFVRAVEGAEDSQTMGEEDLKGIHLTPADIVIGLAASGRTPYVIYGLRYARRVGCRTVAVSCNRDSEIGKEADLAIEPVPGPEVLTGSTRLKAGTAQKMVLNMISTGSMVGIGKVYQNLMVDVVQTNKKLITRAENIVMTATGCTREEARDCLEKAEGSVKLAITMILLQCSAEAAEERLNRAGGYVRNAIQDV
ncbi:MULTISPECIES: N-acetylmuramic acid 6-phosphate etherase [unclassified Clostridium]|jgi:N-acetylmuramic acid 6-phosphate etherase|uniref:N-acetylmuramic acid 6-phosphate etherase n=1 Tax=unclassified Clostridium TaxID=2614128 RepID=UPI001106B7D4|nr:MULTISPECIES: N-acetylmuramic acid 6-phosphate etherase [unclassified Clostridium]